MRWRCRPWATLTLRRFAEFLLRLSKWVMGRYLSAADVRAEKRWWVGGCVGRGLACCTPSVLFTLWRLFISPSAPVHPHAAPYILILLPWKPRPSSPLAFPEDRDFN